MRLILILIILSFTNAIVAQKYFRIKGEYSQKSKSSTGKSQLTIGKFYFDRNYEKIVHINSFPSKEIWVSSDTSLYRIKDNKVFSRKTTPVLSKFSIFYLALSGNIQNYGFKNSQLLIESIKKANDTIITTWYLPKKEFESFGRIKTATRNNKLIGLVFLKNTGEVLKKQFFNNYISIKGIEFPQEMIDITYIKGKENYQVTTYKNIIIDDLTEGNIYNYSVPGIR